MLRTLLASIVLFASLALAQSDPSQPAFPSNASDYRDGNDTEQLVIGWTDANRRAANAKVYNLTSKAYDVVNHTPTTLSGQGNFLVDLRASTIDLLDVQLSNSQDPGPPISFISCDTDAGSDSNIDMTRLIDTSIDKGAAGILLYSISQNFCNISMDRLSEKARDFGLFYSMTDLAMSGNLQVILSMTHNPQGVLLATIQTAAAQDNNAKQVKPYNGLTDPTPGTAVAMIILYSITGVIALLFVIIIVTGAIRAHRHPERYGPRNVAGVRVRQTRAQGIGRAMLESLPLVKFGEPQPAKTTDVELANSNSNTNDSTTGGAPGTTQATHSTINADGTPSTDRDTITPHSNSSSADASHVRTLTAPDASGVAVSPNATHTEKIEKSLECAICWEDFTKGEEVRMLPCEHKFHPKCIDPWLLDFSGTCPVCRIDFGEKKDKKTGSDAAGTAAGASASGSANGTGAVAGSSTT